MLNPKLVAIVIAGLLVGAGTAQAAGTAFPSSAIEVPSSLYAETLQHETARALTGAAQPVFPSVAMEHGSSLDARIESRRAAHSPSVGSRASPVFPVSAIEVL